VKRVLPCLLLLFLIIGMAGCASQIPWSFCVNSLYYSDYISPWKGIIIENQPNCKWITADVSITNLTESPNIIPDWHSWFSLVVLATDGWVYSFSDSIFPEAEYCIKRNEPIPALTTVRGELYFSVPEEMIFVYAVSMGILMGDAQYVEPNAVPTSDIPLLWLEDFDLQEEAEI